MSRDFHETSCLILIDTLRFAVGGYRVDLIVEGDQARLAVECDGDRWHGAEQYEEDLHRQRKLERAGWQFCRVRGSAFYADADAAMRPIWLRLAELGIRSMQSHREDEND